MSVPGENYWPPMGTFSCPPSIGSHWPFEEWGKFLPEHTTAVSLLDRLLHHSVVVVTDGESFRMKEARQKGDRSTLAKT